jgi:two-component system, NarL family, nitrate/nitrite response regulator NarL
MDSGGHQVTSGELASTPIGILIVSEVRFLRQCLAEILAHNSDFRVCGQSATLTDALVAIQALRPDIVLLDVGFPGGFGAVPKFVCVLPQIKVVALAIAETEESVLGWVDAGVAGYVPNTATIDELLSLLVQISRGEQTCAARITGCLMRRAAAGERGRKTEAPSAPLTHRESQILQLVGKGLSNKAIARSLHISLGTTKSHVHNMLGKLNLQRRGEATAYCAARDAGSKLASSAISTLSRSSGL